MLHEKLEGLSNIDRLQGAPFRALIERVMDNDYFLFPNESYEIDDSNEMNFNRIETLIQNKLLYKSQEVIQLDW